MIKYSAILALIFLIVFSLSFDAFKSETFIPPNQVIDNISKGQRFINNDSDSIRFVITGSSLSSRIDINSKANSYNLAFQGCGIFDGLELIEKRKTPVKYVLIESNMILRSENEGFTDVFRSETVNTFKKKVPAFQIENQPLSIVGNRISYKLGQIIRKLKSLITFEKQEAKSQEEIKVNKENNGVTEDLFEAVLQKQIPMYTIIPANLSENLNLLERQINELQKQGTKIIFFEMPVNARLCSMPMPVAVRDSLKSRFTRDGIYFIEQDDCSKYKTTDGLHLTKDESIIYSNYLTKKVNTIIGAE